MRNTENRMFVDWLVMTAGMSASARGLLMEAMALMFCRNTAEMSGTLQSLALALRCSVPELHTALTEIESLENSPLQVRYISVTNPLQVRYISVTLEEVATIKIIFKKIESAENERIRIREAVRKSRAKKAVTSPLQDCYIDVTENKEQETKEKQKEKVSPTPPIKEKIKEKKEEETKDFSTHTVTIAQAHTHEEDYPKTTDDILDIVKAHQFQIGMSMSYYQAEEYFSVRAATDWYDKNRNKVLPKNIPHDIKRWLLNSRGKEKEQIKRKDRSGL